MRSHAGYPARTRQVQRATQRTPRDGQAYHHTLITATDRDDRRWTDADKDRLTSMLDRHCYPGGSADRKDPSGVEPLRRWRARRGDARAVGLLVPARALPHLQLS
jgi:hypothetical protein